MSGGRDAWRPGSAAYIAGWQPSSVSPQAADFARAVVARAAPGGRERAKNLLWAAGRLADWAHRAGPGPGAGGAAAPLGDRAVHRARARADRRDPADAADEPAVPGPARRPALAPADTPLPREHAKAPYTPGEIDGYLALADAQPTAARRMRAAGLVCLGAGAGLIRADLRAGPRHRHQRRSGGVIVTVRGHRPRAVPVLARYHAAAAGRRGVRRDRPGHRRALTRPAAT